MILKTLKSTSLALITVVAESMYLPNPDKILELLQLTIHSMIRKIPLHSGAAEEM